MHHFYHQLCPPCAELNYAKRLQTADLAGYVCVVTGGRVRIGFEIVLKLLQAGAYVLTTTRFPADAAARYAQTPGFAAWGHRLEVCGPLELSNVRLVEQFCKVLLLRFPRIHALINNAAQTLTRAPGWEVRMAALEARASDELPPAARARLSAPTVLGLGLLTLTLTLSLTLTLTLTLLTLTLTLTLLTLTLTLTLTLSPPLTLTLTLTLTRT